MRINRLIAIIPFITLLGVAIFLLMPGTNAERKGEDSSPPDDYDWIIDSPGNYIGNETDWMEVIPPVDPEGEPTVIEHYDHIPLNGSIIIKAGGELTLYNTTINMTDNEGFYIVIEEGGVLNMVKGDDMNATTKIHNGNRNHIRFLEIKGNLTMNMSHFDTVDYLFVNSSTPHLSVFESSFSLWETAFISDQILNFESVSFISMNSTPLSLFNTTIDWNYGFLISQSNTTDNDVLVMTESTVNANRITVTSNSDLNACVFLEYSTFFASNKSKFNTIMEAIPIISENSIVHLKDNFSLTSKAEYLLIAHQSTVILEDSKMGNSNWWLSRYYSGFEFEDCDVTINNVNFFRMSGNLIQAEDSDIHLTKCNIWNVTGSVIDQQGGTIDVHSVNLYNIRADAFVLNQVVGTITNVTMDEDDRNFTTGLPYPPIFAGYGYGIFGYGISLQDSDIDIINSTFSAHEMDAVHAIDSTVDIHGSFFRAPGWLDTNDVHGIYMENSTGQITENHFNTPYRGDGYDLFALNMVPMNLTDFTEMNNFSGGRIVKVKFTLNIRVINELGQGVANVDVNLSNNIGENNKLSSTIVGGWIRSPFTIPAYEIYRYAGVNNETNESYEYFTNETFNDHHLIVTKKYKTYNFAITTELDINITRSMDFSVVLNVSTPELSVKSAGIFPQVLQGEEIEITVVIRNFGEGKANNVNISYYYALNDTEDWMWFGSNIRTIPGLLNGGNNSQYATSAIVDAPLGEYKFKIIIDPANGLPERDETNNEYIIEPAFTVLSKPRIVIEFPEELEMLNGSYLISGYAEDDYQNTIDIELMIDGIAVTVSDITNNGEILLWNFLWDTTVPDMTQGKDKYENGNHIISARCTNDNPTGYDFSEWFNVTVAVANPPKLMWEKPFDSEFINMTGALPLYTVEVKVIELHDLTSVKFQMDDGPLKTMNNYGGVFKYTDDMSNYLDGYHTLTYFATYGYGNLTDSVTILLNSPAEESLPIIDTDPLELTDNGLTVQGFAQDDFQITFVKVRLDDGPWITVNESNGIFSTFHYFWPRNVLTPDDSHRITVRAFDGFDYAEDIRWIQVDRLFDLTINDIELPPSGVKENDWVNFTIVAENTGPYDSPPIDIVMYFGNIIRTVDDLIIPANSEERILVQWKAKPGNHSVAAEINPTQKNEETDPTNNLHVDDNIIVKAVAQEGASDESDISTMLMVALIVMVVLGVIAAVVSISGKKK